MLSCSGANARRYNLMGLNGVRAIAMALGVVTLVSACSSLPTQEMSDARQAIESARQAGAGDSAPYPFDQALALIDEARESMVREEYKRARSDALAARSFALSARNIAIAIGDAERAINVGRDDGHNVGPAMLMVKQARAAARDGDEERAIELARKAARSAR